LAKPVRFHFLSVHLCFPERKKNMRRTAFAFGLIVLAVMAQQALAGPMTALEEYVAKPDAAYKWSLAKTIPGRSCTTYILDLTSQAWPKATNKKTWQHYVQVIVPTATTSHTAFLLVEGGSTAKEPPKSADQIAMTIAAQTNSIAIFLSTVPNEPLTFADEPQNHTEDEIICYTFDKYMKTGDSSWIAYLPMVNSAIRCMDAVQEFLPTIAGHKYRVDDFVVGGGSKRGWTTWLTTAVDPKSRVKAMIPAVADLANLPAQVANHRKHYKDVSAFMVDGYSLAVKDYVHYNIFPRFLTQEGKPLLDIVDPVSYFDRPNMKVPKYIVNGADDEFYPPSSSQLYMDKLQGPSYLRYVPNAGHKLNLDAVQGLIYFYGAIKDGAALPKFTSSIEDGGKTIIAKVVDKPEEVLLWQATNPKSHDFRDPIFGKHWTSSKLSEQGDGVYRAEITAPPTGATAAFIELRYKVNNKPIKFTTSVSVLPMPK
jgi:PhoPQ-activated pathogenicity-related protein